jgi:hypothetical protein
MLRCTGDIETVTVVAVVLLASSHCSLAIWDMVQPTLCDYCVGLCWIVQHVDAAVR